jgi:hypothetical protein
LGKITANNSALYQPIGPAFANPIFGPSAFFNGALYFGPRDGAIVKFVFSQAKLSTSPAVRTSDLFAAQGTVPAVSAFVNSAGMASNGIVWSIGLAPLTTGGGATLHAYDATNLATLFTSTPLATGGTKFSVPTISNSMAYLGTIGAVYGFAGIATPSNSASNVTTASGVKIITGPITRDPATGLFLQTVTVKNAGITALFKTPLSFVLDKLGTNAELLNGSGATTYLAPLASPYLNFALAAPLAPGASVSLNLQFLNSSGGAITYTARLLDGLGYR